MLHCGVTAATDVTGFGLIGHAATFDVGAELELARIPLQEGIRELAEQGLFPGGTERNYRDLREQVDWGGLAEIDRLILCDAQTSGGILAAIPAARGDEFEALFAGAPYPAARIGRIDGAGQIRIRP
jgi:selenide,water dikinase